MPEGVLSVPSPDQDGGRFRCNLAPLGCSLDVIDGAASIQGEMMFNKSGLAGVALAAAACVMTPFAAAQGAYPTKPIKIIAPVQPGGGVDLVARTIGERITKAL